MYTATMLYNSLYVCGFKCACKHVFAIQSMLRNNVSVVFRHDDEYITVCDLQNMKDSMREFSFLEAGDALDYINQLVQEGR